MSINPQQLSNIAKEAISAFKAKSPDSVTKAVHETLGKVQKELQTIKGKSAKEIAEMTSQKDAFSREVHKQTASLKQTNDSKAAQNVLSNSKLKKKPYIVDSYNVIVKKTGQKTPVTLYSDGSREYYIDAYSQGRLCVKFDKNGKLISKSTNLTKYTDDNYNVYETKFFENKYTNIHKFSLAGKAFKVIETFPKDGQNTDRVRHILVQNPSILDLFSDKLIRDKSGDFKFVSKLLYDKSGKFKGKEIKIKYPDGTEKTSFYGNTLADRITECEDIANTIFTRKTLKTDEIPILYDNLVGNNMPKAMLPGGFVDKFSKYCEALLKRESQLRSTVQ